MVRAAGARRLPELSFNRGTPPALRGVLETLWRNGYHVRLEYGDRVLSGYLSRNPIDHRLVLVRTRGDRVGDMIRTSGVEKVQASLRGPKKPVYDASVLS